MKKTIAFLLAVCLMVALCACGNVTAEPEKNAYKKTEPATNKDSVTVEGPGFDSPEKAIVAYANALKKGDVQEMLSTFAIESYVGNFDMAAYLERVGAYSINMQIVFPSSDEYTLGLNLIARQYYIVKQLNYMYLTLGDMEDFTIPVSFRGNPYNSPDELLDDLVIDNWMEMLSKMEIGEVLTCEDLSLDDDNVKRSLDIQMKSLCCEDLVPLALELTLDGKNYYLCADMACYNGKWYVCNLLGVIGQLLGADAMSGGLCMLED